MSNMNDFIKTEKISIRVSDDEKILIKSLAQKNNLSISDFLRNVIFNSVLNLNGNTKYNDNSTDVLVNSDITNKIQDIFDNVFKNYYLTYKLAEQEFGVEQTKFLIDKTKQKLKDFYNSNNNKD